MSERDPDNAHDAVLAANEAFYRAFAAGDFEAMEKLWSARDDASCVHPGWPPVMGRAKVMETWRGILGQPPKPPIQAVEPKVRLHGDSAFVVCWEAIGDTYLVASNFFVREGAGWRMVHHQSGQTERKPRSAQPPRAGTTIH